MHYYTTQDYMSRYHRTYVGELREGVAIPLYVSDVFKDGRMIKFSAREVLSTGDLGEERIIHVQNKNLILRAPPLGLVQDNGELFYVRRKPHRRWKQGLSLDSCEIVTYVRSRRTEEKGVNVYRIFNPQRTPYEEAIQKVLQGGKKAYSITRSVGVVPSVAGKAHVVHKARKVGEYFQEGEVLRIIKGFDPLSDTMRRAGFNNIEVQDD